MRGGERRAGFPETRWSQVRDCSDPDSPDHRARLDDLFGRYWLPVFGFILRTWTQDPDQARDLTQTFFLALLERGTLRHFDTERGRFRTFLLAAVKNFLRNVHRDSKARKRHPGEAILSLDGLWTGGESFDVPDRSVDPEVHFNLDFKRSVIKAAIERLKRDAAGGPWEEIVDVFRDYYLEDSALSRKTYDELAEEFGISYSKINNGFQWARRTFARHLRQEVRDLVASEEDLTSEMTELFTDPE